MVYVQNTFGQPLMPMSDGREVRLLLKAGKAVVIKKSPFTIRLKVKTKQYVQPVVLGVDAGSKHVGVSACTEKKTIPEKVLEELNDDYFDLGHFETNKNGVSVLYIEEVCGDISDDLNGVVGALELYNIKPLVGEYNRYYGDYEGYDVFDGAAFISMDDKDYGAWLNEQAHAKTIAAAKKVVDYFKFHGEDSIPAELRALIEELENTLQK